MSTLPERATPSASELADHGLVLLSLSLALWFCLDSLFLSLRTDGEAPDSGLLLVTLATAGALHGIVTRRFDANTP